MPPRSNKAMRGPLLLRRHLRRPKPITGNATGLLGMPAFKTWLDLRVEAGLNATGDKALIFTPSPDGGFTSNKLSTDDADQ